MATEIQKYIRLVKDNGDVILTNLVDSNTGESVEYIKIPNPTGITPDGVIYRELDTAENGTEIFKRIYSGYADVRWFGVKNSNTGLENTNMLNHCLRVCRNVIIDEDLDIEIDETINYPSLQINLRNGILVPSNTNLVINGRLRFTNPISAYYGILCLSDVNNVHISGTGIIEGSYLLNYQPSGSGHGVAIYDCQNIKIEDLTIKNCLGDGVYVIGRGRDVSDIMCENLSFRRLTLEGNSRQGISLIKANQAIVDNCLITLTGTLNGSVLGCGIDIEPEYHRTVSNTIIKECTFIDNLNNPINLLCLKETSEIRDISILNNYIQQGGPSGVSYTINIRKGAPNLAASINNVYIKNNNISLNSTSIQRGISMSNVVDNIEISDNVINKTVPHSVIGGGYRGVSIASAKTVKIFNNTILGEFDYGIYQEGSYSGNIFINDNILSNCIYGCYFRQASNINIKSNTITNVEEAINTASVNDLFIDKNLIQNVLGCAISLRTNVINSKITFNTLIDCAINTALNTGLSDVERSWISVASSIPASPTRCVDVLNNFFRRSETTPIFRHIQCPDNNTQICNILENVSTTETLIILNLSTTGELKYPHRKFGITAQRPATLPANYAGPFYDTVEDTLYYWGGAAWESINALATETVKGVVRKSAVVEGIQANDVTNQPLSTATTLEELVTSHNNLVGRYNQVVTLLNETKLKVNQSLNTEKAAGQRTST